MSEIEIYNSPENNIELVVNFDNDTVWLNRDQISALFSRDIKTIGKHINNVFKEEELEKKSVVAKFATTAADGKKYNVEYYNLDVIISVGYRVKSKQGTQFRKWATERLREYLIKGFTMDDERLKETDGRARYFEELLQRIRDIRSSERRFYQKVTDIYATSIDYKIDAELTQKFFATVQNKMHFAVCGKTAAKIIAERADATKPFMGLNVFKGDYIIESDIVVAKNYLNENELMQLNLIVSLYIDFAELQASSGRLMKMQDWIKKLDEFLTISEKKLLHNSGKVSAFEAENKAVFEFEKYRKERDKKFESDFDREFKRLMDNKKLKNENKK